MARVRAALTVAHLLVGFALASGCTGEIVLPQVQDLPAQKNPASFTCNPGSEGTATPLRRLSATQYRKTLEALFAVAPTLDVKTVAASPLSRLPTDEADQSFRGMDARLSENHVDVFYEVADLLAAGVIATDVRLKAVAGNCAVVTPVPAVCVGAFLDGFAARAFRRTLSADERTRYLALNDGTRDARELFRSLVFSLLMAPQFLYHVEVEGTPVGGTSTRVALSPFELASRLAYHFWQRMPDAELFAAASSGALSTDDGYERQLQRLVADPRTQETVAGFYAEWFQLGRIPQFPATAVFASFAQGTTIGQPGADHLEAADAEIADLTAHFTWQTRGRPSDLLLTDLSFTRSPHLAAIYGVPAWDGTSPQPHLPSSERAGILTRMSLLLSGNHTTHPIHRGSVVRRRMLCEVLEIPSAASLPPGALVPPAPNSQQTTRVRFENKVLNEPCASCHKRMNPIGYVLEQYDALGRFRKDERILDEVTGAQLSLLPVDSSAVPALAAGDATVLSTGPALSARVAEGGKFDACFARQYFRFTHHRLETDDDGCALERVRVAAAGDEGSLKDALIEMAREPGFRTRR